MILEVWPDGNDRRPSLINLADPRQIRFSVEEEGSGSQRDRKSGRGLPAKTYFELSSTLMTSVVKIVKAAVTAKPRMAIKATRTLLLRIMTARMIRIAGTNQAITFHYIPFIPAQQY